MDDGCGRSQRIERRYAVVVRDRASPDEGRPRIRTGGEGALRGARHARRVVHLRLPGAVERRIERSARRRAGEFGHGIGSEAGQSGGVPELPVAQGLRRRRGFVGFGSRRLRLELPQQTAHRFGGRRRLRRWSRRCGGGLGRWRRCLTGCPWDRRAPAAPEHPQHVDDGERVDELHEQVSELGRVRRVVVGAAARRGDVAQVAGRARIGFDAETHRLVAEDHARRRQLRQRIGDIAAVVLAVGEQDDHPVAGRRRAFVLHEPVGDQHRRRHRRAPARLQAADEAFQRGVVRREAGVARHRLRAVALEGEHRHFCRPLFRGLPNSGDRRQLGRLDLDFAIAVADLVAHAPGDVHQQQQAARGIPRRGVAEWRQEQRQGRQEPRRTERHGNRRARPRCSPRSLSSRHWPSSR